MDMTIRYFLINHYLCECLVLQTLVVAPLVDYHFPQRQCFLLEVCFGGELKVIMILLYI